MGFQLNNSAAAVMPASNVRQFSDGKTKASGFLNIYIPVNDGQGNRSKRKLGTIALRADKPIEKAIMDRLAADPEGGIEALLGALEINYQPWNEEAAANELAF